MEIKITFRGMESSPTIEEYVNTKINKLERFLLKERSPIILEVILDAEHVHTQHAVELRLHCADYHVRAQVSGKDLYSQVDEAFDVLLREINEKKEKRIDARKESDQFRKI